MTVVADDGETEEADSPGSKTELTGQTLTTSFLPTSAARLPGVQGVKKEHVRAPAGVTWGQLDDAPNQNENSLNSREF